MADPAALIGLTGTLAAALIALTGTIIKIAVDAKRRRAQTGRDHAEAARARADAEESTAAAAHYLTTAAHELIEPLRKQANTATDEARAARDEARDAHTTLLTVQRQLADHIDQDRAQKEARARAYAAHAQWDQQVTDQMRQAGMTVSDPPPLHETHE
ncbi:hypothetical protein [Tomitella fengzijianii]|uniref:Uncharacterized protein n=1 Tax=Tomitella fengzijianii TaxID=2597660 RepID=A0A516X4L2_9ACTN|nr:hypothetical protein [Tomitella fengzijianii]QDQ97990.1 hypothetical protein FO059_12520 [Tomitella fengzijianii]